jgi:hypothetical protein
MPPDWILCLRHGEKLLDDNGDEMCGLSVAGLERARLLADALDVGGSLLPDGAVAPSQIFVPDYEDGAEAHRAYQTIAPLAKRLGVEPARHERDDVGGLADLAHGSHERVVVICWEHDALAAWLQRFAGGVAVTQQGGALPLAWKKDRFDLLWRLRRHTRDSHEAYEFSERRQDLAVEEVYDPRGQPVGYVNRDTGKFVAQPSRDPRSRGR